MINNAQKSNKIFLPLTSREEEIGKIIVNCAYKVHKELGPGLWKKFTKFAFVMNFAKPV